jgi:hypothetical protein
MAIKIPVWAVVDQCEVIDPITGRQALNPTPKVTFKFIAFSTTLNLAGLS